MLLPPPSRWGFRTWLAAVEGSVASFRPSEPGCTSYCGAKVERRLARVEAGWWGRKCSRVLAVVRACCTFLEPARWVRTVGHLMAALRSRWWRAVQEEVVYSVGA